MKRLGALAVWMLAVWMIGGMLTLSAQGLELLPARDVIPVPDARTEPAYGAPRASEKEATPAGATAREPFPTATMREVKPDEHASLPKALGEEYTGSASWYGKQFAGRTTASGEIFNPDAYTAAHKTLSFGTKLLVTNLQNNKSVVVRITDRGPFVGGRVLDLSQQAALDIDMVTAGVVPVSFVTIPQESPVGPVGYTVDEATKVSFPSYRNNNTPRAERDGTLLPNYKRIIQIGSFAGLVNAEMIKEELESYNFTVAIESVQEKGVHRVVIPHVDKDEVAQYVERLKSIGFPSALVRIDYNQEN